MGQAARASGSSACNRCTEHLGLFRLLHGPIEVAARAVVGKKFEHLTVIPGDV